MARSQSMAPIPDNEEQTMHEAQSLGLLQPANFEKIINGRNQLTPRQCLLKCIHETSKLKRSTQQSFILLVGATGSGKSSTINHLFGLKEGNALRAETSDEKSQTHEVQEYILQADYPKYQFKNATLSVIDTPGFNDTQGHEQDLRNINSIKRFMERQPKLKGKKPNLVFVFLNATDNRFLGPHTTFQMTLRFIKHLKIVSRKHPNVVGIVTHACSFGPPPFNVDPDSWYCALNKKVEKLRQIIHTTLNVTAPIVLLENEFAAYNLEQFGEFSKLPREDQPQLVNMLRASLDVLQKNKDSLSEIILDACFQAKNEHPVTTKSGLTVTADEMSEVERSMLNDLVDYDSQMMSNFSAGISSLKHIRLLNHGYDLFSDKETDKEIFVTNTSHTEFGWLLPEKFQIQKYNKIVHMMDAYESVEDYNMEVLKEIGRDDVDIDVKSLDFKMRPGCNIQEVMKGGPNRILSMFCLYSLSIDDFNNALSEEFKSAMNSLPRRFAEDDFAQFAKFHDFFTQWGHYVVTSVLIGGSFSANAHSTLREKPSFPQMREKILPILEFNSNVTNKSANAQLNLSFANQGILFDHVEWLGGNKRYHNDKTIMDKEFWQAWITSIRFEPAVLDRNMKIIPISEVIKSVDEQRGIAAEAALRSLFQSVEAERISFLSVKEPKKPAMPRERVTTLTSAVDKAIPLETQILPSSSQTKQKSTPTTREEAVSQIETPHENENCFALDSFVQIKDANGILNRKYLKDIHVGDKVLSWSRKKRQIVYSPVIAYLDYSEHRQVNFLKIHLEEGRSSLCITGNHLIMAGSMMRFKPARSLNIGDTVWINICGEQMKCCHVINIEVETKMGCIAPLTREGTIIIDDVLSSCYCNVQDLPLFRGRVKLSGHSVAHFSLYPLRVSFQISSIMKMKRKSLDDRKMHPYVKWLKSSKSMPWRERILFH